MPLKHVCATTYRVEPKVSVGLTFELKRDNRDSQAGHGFEALIDSHGVKSCSGPMDQRKRRIHDAWNTKCKRALTEKVNLLDNLHHPIVKVTKLPCPFCTIQAIKIAAAPYGVNQCKSSGWVPG